MYSFPAIKGVMGALDTYLIMIPPGEIPEVVGHDPRGMYDKKLFHLPPMTLELYENVQRSVRTDKVTELEDYTETYSNPDSVGVGALPALSVGLKTAPKFKRQEVEWADDQEIGTLKLLHGAKDNALYLDGLKRACAILNKFDENKLGMITVAVMLFAPRGDRVLSYSDLAQLFYDFNSKSTPIPKNVSLSRDGRDPHIQLANAIAESEAIASNGGVDRKGRSIGNKSKEIVIFKDLVAFVRGACEDEWGVENQKDRPENSPLTPETHSKFQQNIGHYLSAFVDGMTADTFRDRSNHVHLLAPVWMALGVAFHDLHIKLGIRDDELATYGRRIGQLDWGRTALRLSDLRGDKTSNEGKVTRGWTGSGAQIRRALTVKLREELGIKDRIASWKAKKESLPAAAE